MRTTIITGGQEPRPNSTPLKDQLWAVKDAVRIEDVVQDYGEFRKASGERLLGRCVSPTHEDRTPSMSVYPDEQRFKCFGIGCGAHGDVLDLVMLAEGCELWVAMVDLAQRYGVELPGRPDSWYRRQERQRPVRDAIERERIEHIRLLVFRLVWVPWLKHLPGWIREESEAGAWKDSLRIASMLYAGRIGSGKEES